MQFLWILLVTSFMTSGPTWETDFGKAKQAAIKSHKLILVNFSGSDWCGPCIRMHKEIFETPAFNNFASAHLVLVNADFPRLKKHQLSEEQQQKNDQLAERYNKKGIFPLTILLSEDGKVLKVWEGFTTPAPDAFINEIKSATQFP